MIEENLSKETVKKVKKKKEEVAVHGAGPGLAEKTGGRQRPGKPAGTKYYGTGRRKEATAKVWLSPGQGVILINGKDYSEYYCGRKLLEYKVQRPLVITNNRQKFDVYAEVFGGGVPGQAGAVSLGIARALLVVSPDLKTKLKSEGLLTRDPRMKERKKYGLKRARKAFQFSKR